MGAQPRAGTRPAPTRREGGLRLAAESYEESLQGFLIAALFARVGEPGTLRGEGKTARFEIKKALGGGECAADGQFSFTLAPDRKLTHSADILITLPRGKRLALILKWASSDSNPLKAASYDVLLSKQGLGDQISGMMIYLRPGTGGVSATQAQEICFPFDLFFAIEHQDPQNPAAWVPILDRIEAQIASCFPR